MSNILKIGLLGGSFNPAHKGHLHISRITIKKLRLDKLLWLVSPQNPLKDSSNFLSYEQKIETAKAVSKSDINIEVSDLEKTLFNNKSNKKFYSYNFLKRYKALNPSFEIYFIIGR